MIPVDISFADVPLRYRPKRSWVGNDIDAGQGQSLIAWLFNWWILETIQSGDDKAFIELRTGIYWRRQYRQPAFRLQEIYYSSASMAHIQRMLDHQEWSGFDFCREPCADSCRCRSEPLSRTESTPEAEKLRLIIDSMIMISEALANILIVVSMTRRSRGTCRSTRIGMMGLVYVS